MAVSFKFVCDVDQRRLGCSQCQVWTNAQPRATGSQTHTTRCLSAEGRQWLLLTKLHSLTLLLHTEFKVKCSEGKYSASRTV